MGSAFSMNASIYFNRWCIIPSCGLFGYRVTATSTVFTRSSSAYELSSQSIGWNMQMWNCNSQPDPHSISGGGFIPIWYGNTSETSWYYAPMNSWPVLGSDLFEVYQSAVSQGSDVTESGYYAGHLSNSFVFPKN